MSTLRKTMSTSTSFDVDHVIRCTRPSASLSLGGQRSNVIYCAEGGGPGTEANSTYFAHFLMRHKDIPCSQVSVYESFAREVAHSWSYLSTETQQQTWCMFRQPLRVISVQKFVHKKLQCHVQWSVTCLDFSYPDVLVNRTRFVTPCSLI